MFLGFQILILGTFLFLYACNRVFKVGFSDGKTNNYERSRNLKWTCIAFGSQIIELLSVDDYSIDEYPKVKETNCSTKNYLVNFLGLLSFQHIRAQFGWFQENLLILAYLILIGLGVMF